VVKPAISAAARDTWRVGTPAPDDEARFQALLQRGTVLVQPYMDVIATQGELSMIFIDGRFSHAVVKRPRHGDFRVQATHGGVADVAYPSEELVRQGAAILRAAPTAATAPLYARVDGVVVDGVLLLMELELIEPSLFFTGQPHGVERFAAALARRIRASATPLPEAARVRSPAV
jgi:glutathione synthase/RimK-type ligase-like ATP-grasp enzyme